MRSRAPASALLTPRLLLSGLCRQASVGAAGAGACQPPAGAPAGTGKARHKGPFPLPFTSLATFWTFGARSTPALLAARTSAPARPRGAGIPSLLDCASAFVCVRWDGQSLCETGGCSARQGWACTASNAITRAACRQWTGSRGAAAGHHVRPRASNTATRSRKERGFASRRRSAAPPFPHDARRSYYCFIFFGVVALSCYFCTARWPDTPWAKAWACAARGRDFIVLLKLRPVVFGGLAGARADPKGIGGRGRGCHTFCQPSG